MARARGTGLCPRRAPSPRRSSWKRATRPARSSDCAESSEAADEDSSAELSKAFRKRDIQVRVGTKVENVKVLDKGVEVQVSSEKSGKETLKADVVLVAVGRRPVTETLQAELA